MLIKTNINTQQIYFNTINLWYVIIHFEKS